MTIVAISKSETNDKFAIEKLAEDIWLVEDGGAISFIDIFIEAERSSPPIKSIKLGTMGEISKVIDVSNLYERLAKRWKESVATDQYKSGIFISEETDCFLRMSIDGIEANISRMNCNFRQKSSKAPTGNIGSAIEIALNPPIEAGETRGLKICCRFSKLSKKEDSIWELTMYPYCSYGLGGVNFFSEEGITTESMIEVRDYYMQVILPPSFDYDRVKSTQMRSEDYCYCDECNKFCPYLTGLVKDISLQKERRLFLRWKAERLTEWTDKFIIHVFYFSKPKIAKVILEKALKAAPRYSSQSVRVLLILGISRKSLSADDIYHELSLSGGEVVRGAVYYTLRKLKKDGLLLSVIQRPKGRGKPPTMFYITEKGKETIGL